MSIDPVALLADAGPEINELVIALHHEIAGLRQALQATNAQMVARNGMIGELGAEFERILNARQREIDSLREARRQLKGRVRQLEEGGPIVALEPLAPLSPGWATHRSGGRPCLVVAEEGSYRWVLFHPNGRPRTRSAVDVGRMEDV